MNENGSEPLTTANCRSRVSASLNSSCWVRALADSSLLRLFSETDFEVWTLGTRLEVFGRRAQKRPEWNRRLTPLATRRTMGAPIQ